jgi:hypothetical protein
LIAFDHPDRVDEFIPLHHEPHAPLCADHEHEGVVCVAAHIPQDCLVRAQTGADVQVGTPPGVSFLPPPAGRPRTRQTGAAAARAARWVRVRVRVRVSLALGSAAAAAVRGAIGERATSG